MKKLFLLALAISAACLSSCNKENDVTCLEDESDESYVYRERDSNSPLILSCPRVRTATRATQLEFDDLLGRSFKLDFFPFENMYNVGEPVVNLTKLETENRDWITKRILRQSTSPAFSYSTFDRYEENSTITNKVNSGFELNLGIFKIGNKKTYYEHFASSLIQNSNSVFGQLDIEIQDAIYNLAVNSNRLEQIRKDYISKDFIDDLYNLPPHELFRFYGPFVMTNFTTGGRATALFAGITKTTTTAEGREQTMDSEISTSFSFKKNESMSTSLGFGKGFTNGSSSTKTFTQLYTTLITSGGSYGLGAFTSPKSIDNMNIDLSAWANSLNNVSTHTLIDVQDSGLVPLSGFIREENLKKQYEDYVAGIELASKVFVEPRLVYSFQPIHTAGRVLSRMYLVTRFNDAIIIRADIISISPDPRPFLEARFRELCDKYKIKAEMGHIGFDDLNSFLGIAPTIKNPGGFQAGIALEPKMKKYYDTNSKILYLLYNENGQKVGYSIYMAKGDYLLDTYGIRQWVGTLPSITIDYSELINYTLVAL